MPPKSTRGRGRPRKIRPGENTESVAPKPQKDIPGIKYIPSRHNFSSDESDDSLNPPLRSSQPSFLGSHNTLKQLLSAPKNLEPIHTPTRKKAVSSDSPINSASTPISRLKRVTAQLNSPNNWAPSPVHFSDEPPAKRGRGNGESRGQLKSGLQDPKDSREPKRAKPGRPRKTKTPKGEKAEPTLNEVDGRGSPEYTEQVSHHLVELTADDSDFIPSNKRRSSYNNRGKRQSSVGNGYSSKPHSEVAAEDYYKQLDPSLPEPNQMRQLLTWCFKKTAETDPDISEESREHADTAKGIAKVISQELLSDLSNGEISTSWYSLRDPTTELAGKRVVKPNPLNEANKESIEVFKRKLRSLELEKLQWREALESNLRKVSGLAKIREAVDEAANEPSDAEIAQLQRHLLARGGSEISRSVLGPSTLVEHMEAAAKDTEQVIRSMPAKMNQLFHISYQLKQSLGLVNQVENELLSAQVSKLVRTFMARNDQTNKWTHVSARNLMKGIARMDSSKKKALDKY